MIVYHQKIKEGSHKLFLGEDAYPYADKDCLLVADGLGGRGGYPHKKINPDILDIDKFYDLVFGPVFEKETDEEFKSFVKTEFSEIFETKDYYFENDSTIRTSGYYASRLVACVVLYELKYNDYFNKESVFDAILKDPHNKEVISEYGDKLCALILEKLEKIANNVGFELETRIKGAYLLPTTLQLTLTYEKEEKIHALYFWAGDARAYMWDKDGLAQITDDHEKDETMTNLITLTRSSKIETRFLTFDKPCVLFNATDGCYKCPSYASPLEMEFDFLNAVNGAESYDETACNLSDRYKVIGRHDDSNTMALHAFGYSFAELKNAVKARLEEIDRTIVARLPGIFTVDYLYEKEKCQNVADKIVFADANQWPDKYDEVYHFVKTRMIENDYPPYEEIIKKWPEEYDDKLESFFENTSNDEIIAGDEAELGDEITAEGEVEPNDDIDAVNLRNKAMLECTQRYWRVNKEGLMREIWAEHRELLPKDYVEEIEKNLKISLRQYDEVNAAYDVREKIYADYMKKYLRYYEVSAL